MPLPNKGPIRRVAAIRSSSLLKNISWLGAANLAVKPFWFVFITAVCMRLLGVAEFGIMSAALSLGMIATAFVDLGMTQYSTREISREPGKASLYFSNLMTLRAGNSVLAWLGAVGIAALLDYEGTALLAVGFAAGYTLALNLTNYCRGIYRAFESLREEAMTLVLEKILVIAGGIAFLVATRAAHWTLAGMAIGMAVTTVFNIWWIDRRFAHFRTRLLDGEFIRRSLKIMIPFGLAGLFTVVYYRVDMVMVEALLGETPTGQYGAAFRILEALYMLPTVVALAAIYPRLSRLYHERSYTEFEGLLKGSFLGLAGISIAIASALTLFATPIIHLLDPHPAYGPAAGALQILAWSFPFLCVNSLLYSALISMDFQRFASVALGVAVILNVGLNAVLIPAVGINGAAVATIIPEVVLTGAYLIRYLLTRDRMALSGKSRVFNQETI